MTKKKTQEAAPKKAAKKAAKKKPAKKPKKKGRPTEYTKKIGEKICLGIMNKTPLREICKPENMPDKSTVFRWLISPDHVDFRDQYAQARDNQADELMDDAKEAIAEKEDDFHYVYQEFDGEQVIVKVLNNHARIHRDALKLDGIKWMAGKLAPKKYGKLAEQRQADGKDVEFNVGLAKKVEEGFKRAKKKKEEMRGQSDQRKRSQSRTVVRGNRKKATA